MTDRSIEKLAQRFRDAIESAKHDHAFDKSSCFTNFPTGCCGNTSYLLAEYLLRAGIATIWVSLNRNDGSHAWLVLKDRRVKEPQKTILPAEYTDIISQYRNQDFEEETEDIHYVEQDLRNGLIIDITSDQFDDYKNPVFVGQMDDFHRSFDFIRAVDYDGLKNDRLEHLYEIIESYI